METMDKRILELEKSLKRTRAVLLALVICSLAMGIMAAAGDDVQDVIKCHELVVVGPNGDKSITLGQNQHGFGLGIVDASGKYRLGLGYNTELKGYGFGTWSPQGNYTTILGHGDAGNKGLYIMDDSGAQRAVIAVLPGEEENFLALMDRNGKPIYVKPFSAIKTLKELAEAQQ